MLTRSRLAAPVAGAALILLAGSVPLEAQSDILLRLRSGSPAGDRVRIDSAGGLVALGTLGIGLIPATGNTSNGVRMMWYPFRGVFRAGTPGSSGSTAWDDANLGFYSWAGGANTRATQYATFAFGDGAQATSSYAVAFGASSEVSGSYGFAAGYNARCAATACHAVGYVPNADGLGATALGYRVTADANYSTAIGYRASTNGRTGAFVISDASTTDSTEASANNQFRGRFAGGWRFYTNATQTSGVILNAGASSFSVVSDRARKEEFQAVDGEDVLERIRELPISTWRYLSEEDRTVRHIGPMAQDWHAAFGFSPDSLTINQGDFDGVNLAGVQALERRTAEQAERIRVLEARNAEMEAELAGLRAAVQALLARESGR